MSQLGSVVCRVAVHGKGPAEIVGKDVPVAVAVAGEKKTGWRHHSRVVRWLHMGNKTNPWCRGHGSRCRDSLELGQVTRKRQAMSWPCKRLLGLHYVREERRNLGLQFGVAVGLS